MSPTVCLAWSMPDLSPSPALRTGFLVVVALALVFSVLDGYRDGLGRKVFGIIALLGGIAAGYYGASFWGELVGNFVTYPPLVLRIIGGISGFMIFSIGFSLIGMLVFRPTRKVKDPELRRMVGIGGMVTGTLLGILSIMLLIVMIRVTGSFGASFIRSYGPTIAENSRSEQPTEVKPEATLALDALAWIARLNHSLTGLPGLKALDVFDPVPVETYRVADKSFRVLADPTAILVLADLPETRELLNDPAVQDLLQDPEILALAQKRDINGIISHPRVVALAQNEDLDALLERYNFEAALDATLAQRKANQQQPARRSEDPNAQPSEPIIIIEPIDNP
ncbi:CvpA family protein [Ruficoccus sp. ZRK36]|uniref:CvpA family protein n=1 Tax=Ruficoccus sp. ZRK36 TaxID=2866311 RepID=UPI001C73D9E3|nr:CvpA family protein [Ruficoccus sp. ZRK36]QYY35881.1 CvpA family protein [Ruficoccus sp. ZRK36]